MGNPKLSCGHDPEDLYVEGCSKCYPVTFFIIKVLIIGEFILPLFLILGTILGWIK